MIQNFDGGRRTDEVDKKSYEDGTLRVHYSRTNRVNTVKFTVNKTFTRSILVMSHNSKQNVFKNFKCSLYINDTLLYLQIGLKNWSLFG